MDRQPLFVFVLAICVLNGIFSPYLVVAVPITVALMPEFLPHSPGWIFFLSSVLLSTATLFFSGVPAALYERFFDPPDDSNTSMIIWLAGAAILALPAVRTLAKL